MNIRASIKLFFILTFLLFAVNGWGATYYADPSGGGTTCSEGSPCTLVYAVETKAGSGDIIYVNPGTHNPGSRLDIADDNLSIIGVGSAAVIDSRSTQTGWSQYGATTIYYKTLAAEPKWVTKDSEILTRENDGDGTDVTADSHEWVAADANNGNDNTVWINIGDPSVYTIKTSASNIFFYSTGRTGITISNLIFQFANTRLFSSATLSNSTITGCTFRYGWDYGIALSVGSSGNTISNNSLHDSDVNIFLTNADSNTIQNNEVYSTLGNTSEGIYNEIDSDLNIIRWNYVHDVDGDGIIVKSLTADGSPSENGEIYGNLVVNTRDGISLEGANGWKVYSNTVYYPRVGSQYPCMKLGNNFGNGPAATGNIIRNNIFVQQHVAGQDYRYVLAGGTGGNFVGAGNTIENNLYYKKDQVGGSDLIYWTTSVGDGENWGGQTWTEWVAQGVHDQSSINSDPLFRNAAGGNFRLKSKSDAIDAGVLVSTMVAGWEDKAGTKRLCGDKPDPGCYEYCKSASPIIPPRFTGGSKTADWYTP